MNMEKLKVSLPTKLSIVWSRNILSNRHVRMYGISEISTFARIGVLVSLYFSENYKNEMRSEQGVLGSTCCCYPSSETSSNC